MADDYQALAARIAPYLLPHLLKTLYASSTWTPAFGGTTTDGTLGAYVTQSGQYVRVGGLVVATFHVYCGTVTAAPTGNLTLTGLPFAAAASAGVGFYAAPIHQYDNLNLAANVVQIGGRITAGESRLLLIESYDNGAASVVPGSAITTNSGVLGVAIYATA